MELPTEEQAFTLKRERARKIDKSMHYIAERTWIMLRHIDPPFSQERFENEVHQIHI